MAQSRSLFKEIYGLFLKSLRPQKTLGEIVGRDYMGNIYYEAARETSGSMRKSARWFLPKNMDNFDQDLPPEWMAWLRHRRKHPPTEEEIQINLMKSKEVVRKAKELEALHKGKQEEINVFSKPGFPTYKEYQTYSEEK